jgi:cell division protein FtsZ
MAKRKAKNKIKHKRRQGKINERKTKRESVSDGVHKTKIRVIGVGGGGGSIVSEIISRIKKADFVAANTDARALRAIRGAKQFQFGKDLTHGLGTGMNMEIGEAAAQNEKEKIKKLFEGQDV